MATCLARLSALALLGSVAALGGCNNAGEGFLSGAAIGAGSGAAIGAIVGGGEGAGLGAAIGAIGGAISGAIIGDQNDRNSRAYGAVGSGYSQQYGSYTYSEPAPVYYPQPVYYAQPVYYPAPVYVNFGYYGGWYRGHCR